ncbi:MAG: hypothetical protein IPK83_19405 [Planctomycetes bacterium]|nr:hypothetical protein [Planctomycetota bacterium]
MQRTVNTFQTCYLDSPENGFGGWAGIFPISTTPLAARHRSIGDNRLRKNWNSIGDHIPAHLVNLIIALDRCRAEALAATRSRIFSTPVAAS